MECDHVVPLFKIKPNLFRENNKALHDLTFILNPSPNSAFIWHSNHMHLPWFPDYNKFPHIPNCWEPSHQNQAAKSTCTWISGMWGLQNVGSSRKRALRKVLPLDHIKNRAQGPWGSLHLSLANTVLPEFIWSHPQDNHGRCTCVPTRQTNLFCLPACQQPGVRREGIPPVGELTVQGSVICSVQVSVAPTQKQTWPNPYLSLTRYGTLDISSSEGGEW